MQPVTGPPRSALARSDVLRLLTTTSSVQMQSGVERYDSTFNLVSDLSGSLQAGSSVTSDSTATIHRSCSLVMDSNVALNYLSDYVKPYVTMTDTVTGFTARFNLGMYVLTSPTPDLTLSPGQSTFSGYDLLQVLDQPVGNSYELAAGSEPVAAAAALLAIALPGASISYDVSTVSTSDTFSWPFDSSNQFTYLTIIDGLLLLAGYEGLWCDWDGVFQMHAYVDPNDERLAPEWTFDLSAPEGSTVSTGRSVYQDVFDTPNTWVFIQNNATPVEGSTMLTFTDIWSPITSVPARGRVLRKTVFLDVLDYNSLVNAAAQTIENDLRPTEAFAISTWPIPLFWHRDVIWYNDPALEDLPPLKRGLRRCMVASWTLPLDVAGGNMSMTLTTTSVVPSKTS